MTKILIFLLKFYKKIISPVSEKIFGGSCRFTPSCSEYTITALERFGTVRGVSLGIKRFANCHPWGGFGYDPVPKI